MELLLIVVSLLLLHFCSPFLLYSVVSA